MTTQAHASSPTAARALADLRIDGARADIAKAREAVATSIDALRHQAALWLDWREWIRRNPVILLSGVFLFGALLGSRRHHAQHKERTNV
jgi:hypothetical protein